MSLQEIISNINDAFFKLESFLNGGLTDYEYFDFNLAFTNLFKEVNKSTNYTYENCKLISQYWSLLATNDNTLDKGDFHNNKAFDNVNLVKVHDEIHKLYWDRMDEFDPFIPEDEKKIIKLSITDILDNVTPDIKMKVSKEKTIKFKDNDVINLIFNQLKDFFPENKNEFKKALNGKNLSSPLLFDSNQNKLVEVFRRIKYNDFIISSKTEIKKWICTNFVFRFKKGKINEIRNFKPSSVYDILSKGKGEPSLNERICKIDVLPYKSQSKLQRDAQGEQL